MLEGEEPGITGARRRWRRARPRGPGQPAVASSVATGAGLLTAGRYGVAVLGWAGTLVLVRVLSPQAWGEYSLIFSVMALIGTVADLQVSRIVVREFQTATDDLEETLGSFVTLRLSVGAVCYGAALVVVWVGGYPTIVLAAMAAAALVLVVGSADAALYIFFSSQMWMRTLAVANVLAQMSQLALTVGLALAGFHGLVIFTVPAILFELVFVAWLIRAMRGLIRVRLRFHTGRWWRWLKEAALLSIGAALGSIYMQVDTIMLSKLADLPAVGIYAIGSKFANLVGAVSTAVSTSLLVSLTKTWPEDPEAFVTAFRRAFLLLLVAGTALLMDFGAFATPVVRLLYGHHYAAGAGAAVGLVGAEVLSFLSDLCFVALVAMGRNAPYLVAAALGVVVNVSVNLVLIPRWSYNGASGATVLTEALVLAVLAGVLWRKGPPGEWLPWRPALKVGGAAAAMAAVAFAVRTHLPWEAAAAAATVVYVAVLHVIRVDGEGGLRALIR
jgi:O-antigen/teichoic acid export membrane protein